MKTKNYNPLISVVTASFNSASTIEKSILSVISQCYQSIEYIIIDGGSEDATIDFLKKYDSSLAYWVSESDSGIYFALNKALQVAKGDWILVLGSDDVLLPNAISKSVKYFNDKNSIYYGDVILSSNLHIYDGKFSLYKTMYKNISHQSIFYPKSFYRSNLYNIKYKSAADYEMLMRAVGGGCKIEYIPVTVAFYNNVTGISSLSEDSDFLKDKLNIIKQNYPFPHYILYGLRFYCVKCLNFFGIKNFLKKFLGRKHG